MNNRTTSTIQKQSTTLAQSSSSMILLIVIVAVLVHHHNVDAFAIVKTHHHHHQLFVSTEIETKTVTTACHDQARKYRSAASQQHVLVLSSSSSSLEGEEEEEVEDDDSDSLKENDDKEDDAEETTTSLSLSSTSTSTSTSTSGFRDRVQKFATRIVTKPYRLATTIPDPSAIGQVIKDASYAAVEEVEKEVTSTLLQRSSSRRISSGSGGSGNGSGSGNGNGNSDNIIQSIVDDAFKPMEESLIDMEESLTKAKQSLIQAKVQSYDAIETLQLVALEQQQQAENSVVVMEAQREAVIEKIREVKDTSGTGIDLSELTFDDIDYESSEMAKPFLDFDSCLMTDAEPVVRVEKAPDNSRRIFAGIDILASTDDVWSVLTNYQELQNVIPNLVVNDVLELYDNGDEKGDSSSNDDFDDDDDVSEEVKCQRLSKRMNGSLLRQVGGAKVAGINFSAKTTVEVREWPNGMPDFAHFMDDMWEGKSRETRAKEYPKIKLKRYRFPRPFAVSNLPTRDISMQSIDNDDGEFRLYQGVWRMQPLVGCSPPGKEAMRLTYAVEISPRVYLPVRLVEGRIVQDLCANLEAIRKAVSPSMEE